MRIINKMTYKDFQYSLNSIDDDFNAGRITREQAKQSTIKIKRAYESGEVNRSISSALDKGKQEYSFQ